MPNESIIPYVILTLILCAMEFYSVVHENRIKRQKANNATIKFYGKHIDERR